MEMVKEKLQSSAVVVGDGNEVDPNSCYMQKFRLYETCSVNLTLFFSTYQWWWWCMHWSCCFLLVWSECEFCFCLFDWNCYHVSKMLFCLCSIFFFCCCFWPCQIQVHVLSSLIFIHGYWDFPIGQRNQMGVWRLFFFMHIFLAWVVFQWGLRYFLSWWCASWVFDFFCVSEFQWFLQGIMDPGSRFPEESIDPGFLKNPLISFWLLFVLFMMLVMVNNSVTVKWFCSKWLMESYTSVSPDFFYWPSLCCLLLYFWYYWY